jgi:hypothetical protein
MTPIAQWTPVIIKGGVFQKTFTFTDEDGVAIDYTDFEIVVTPNGASPFTWNVANGQVSAGGTGIYTLFVDQTETAAYAWENGRYRLSVTDPDSNPVPCLIEGLAFARDC